ncbi:MAG TPA: response regulator transcription factor [Steroidobacteraceae bacterium]|jgi:DNA-binding NarL/FixJ family response regulator|nr:response regulator transcription factor [Steroidobacteraceae bacterium]
MNSRIPIRVMLADDHTLFRAGLRALLRALDDIEVVAEGADGREALRLIAAHRPDVALMDIMMPELNGLDAAARVARAFPRTRVVIVSMNADEDSVLKALRAGAAGYLVKSADPAELELAIRATARGETFLSSVVSEHLVAACVKRVDSERTSLERLTQRQREVLQLVAEGHTTKEIATKLGIGVKTAETYRGELMRALGIHDVATLTRYAIRTGLVSLDS